MIKAHFLLDKLEKHLVEIGLMVLIIYLAPYWSGYSEATFLIHDSLNGNIVFNEILINSGKILGKSTDSIDGFMGGLDRGVMRSKFSFLLWLQYIFGGEWSYRILVVLVHLTAYFSMNIWLKRCVEYLGEDNRMIRIFISLLFGLLPFWPHAGIAIAGMPLLFYSFSSFCFKTVRKRDIMVLLLFPFASGFFISSLFVLIVFGLFLFGYLVIRRQILVKGFVWIAVFIMITFFVEHQLIDLVFFQNFVSQRGAGVRYSLNALGFIGISMKLFFLGQYHAHADAVWFVPMIFLGLLYMIRSKSKSSVLLVSVLFIMAILVSFHEIFNWNILQSIFPSMVNMPIQFRFYAIMPLIWHTVLFVSIVQLIKWNIYLRIALPLILSFVMVNRFFNIAVYDYQGLNYAENSFMSSYLQKGEFGYSTFEDYYLTSTMKDLELKYGVSEESRIGCIGFEPQRVQYNGMSTVGGYYPAYRSSFQKCFSDLVFGDSSKESLSRIGRSCYLNLAFKQNSLKDNTMNFSKLKSMPCNIVLSTFDLSSELEYNVADSIIVVEKGPVRNLYVYLLN